MLKFWDSKADAVVKGDNLREISPIQEEIYEDEQGITHLVFSKQMFDNPRYKIPENDLQLFKKFLDGGSRSYPSDGNIPLDVVATEARIIINEIMDITSNLKHEFYEEACDAMKNGGYGIVRGCVKIYLEKYTTRDWRRKRFTDDIDFWIFELRLFEHILKKSGWKKNPDTKEWEKQVDWIDYDTNNKKSGILIASNDLDQRMSFGNGSYLDGSDLKSIFKKKIKRGHDVDLSDVINVAMLQNNPDRRETDVWQNAWESIEESANTRDSRIISNLISLCRYAYAIADYIERVGNSIRKYNRLIFNKNEYSNSELKRLCRYSPHWMGYFINNGAEATRSMIYNFLIEQQHLRQKYANNLKNFADSVLKLLNSKVKHADVQFEIN
ncbi:MAG: hypothetical protein GF311_14405 [Candidatus Lokiarchaeota archaeon]|nr:hypothetical protein [Candidatus Lokiarchaeota archaeon]